MAKGGRTGKCSCGAALQRLREAIHFCFAELTRVVSFAKAVIPGRPPRAPESSGRAVGAEAPHHKACKAQPNEGPPGLRREEIRHPRSPGGLVARHDGRCRVAVEIEAHCDECFLAGGARGGKHRTRSGQIDA